MCAKYFSQGVKIVAQNFLGLNTTTITNMSVKMGMGGAVHSPQFHNSEKTIAYCTLCRTLVFILRKFPALPESQYEGQFNCAPEIYEAQFGSVVTMS